MKKLILATATATALIAGISAVKAADPGEEKAFHERGNFDAAMQWRGPAPGYDGLYQYQGSERALGYSAQGTLASPWFDQDYED